MSWKWIYRKSTIFIFGFVLLFITSVIIFTHFINKYSHNDYLADEFQSQSNLGTYTRYAVSTDSKQCAPIGKHILDLNGSAGDAAIAMLLCMGVTTPQSMGLGGGSLILYYNSSTKQTLTIDAREVAPRRAHKDLLLNYSNPDNRLPLSIGVPGELAGYWELHQRFGRLEWSQLFTGAIHLARNGYQVSHHLESYFQKIKQYLVKFSELREMFIDAKTGKPYKHGDLIKNENLAQTLEMLANSSNPIELFYKGVIAQNIIQDIQEFTNKYNLFSIITTEDFADYKTRNDLKVVETQLTKDNLTYHSFPLPGSGNLLAFILKVMDQYSQDMDHQTGHSLNKTVLFWHRLIETFKFAYSRRALLESDMSPDNPLVSQLTSDEYIKQIKDSIDDSKTFPIKSGKYGPNIYVTEDKGTAHVSVVDGDGNAVSITSTTNHPFGSKILSKSTGILLNNELFDFNYNYTKYKYPANQTNLITPGKRPLSSMCPTIVTDPSSGAVRLAIGGIGGIKITTGVALVMLRHLWFDEDIKTAIDSHRLHHQLSPDHIVYEPHFSQQILSSLQKMGHKLHELDGRSSSIMAISGGGHHHQLQANADYRKGGDVDGL